ncbi:MAG: hypothetical protein Q8937_17255 [Bacteroidota bacterium]|nr:hypothetical protein [Bacteroidota bacterium]
MTPLPSAGTCLLAVLLICGRPAHAQPGSPTGAQGAGNQSAGYTGATKDSSLFGDSHHFLWFTGHWSTTKKHVFVVDKGSGAFPAGGSSGGGSGGGSGGTVTVNPDGSVNLSGPGVDEWNKKVGEAQKQIDDWVQQLSNPANNADLRTQHLNNLLLPEAQEQQQQWSEYRIDKKQDVLTPDTRPGDTPPSQPAAPQRTLNDAATDMCNAEKADYDKVMAYYKSIKKEKEADLNVPPPPEFEYDCYVCDSDRRKVYDTTIAHYVRDFMHPEDSMIRKALGMMRSFLLLNGNENTISGEVDQAFSKAGACHYLSYGELNDAMLTIITHMYLRAEKLVDKYKNDFRACEAIARTFVTVARNFALVTGNTSSSDSYLAELAPIVARAFDFYYQQVKQNNWKQVANIPLLMGLARQISLLGSDMGDYRFQDYFEKLKVIMNDFVLTIDMDTKFGKDQGYWISHVKGQCHIGPDFDQDSNQCYKWVVLDEKMQDPNGFYKTKALQEIDCKLIANQITGSQYSPVYVGTKKYTITLKGLRMDFCSPGQDTIILSSFSPSPRDSGWWRIPHAPLQNLGISGEQFFVDVKKQKELVNSGEAQKAANNYQSQSEQMIARMKQMAEQMKSDTGRKTFQDYQKIMEMANQVKQSANQGVLAKVMFLDFELPVKNNQRELVKKTFDGKQINPQAAGAVVYANFTVLIENESVPRPKQP